MKIKGFWLFIILTFLLSWLLWLPGILITNNYIEPDESITLLDNIFKWIGGLIPSVVAIILIYKDQGKDGIKVLISRVFKLRLSYWYFPIFLIIPVTILLAHSINILSGHPFPKTEVISEPWMILPLFILFLIKLQAKWNALTSSIILGGIWAIWHIPMFLSKGFGHHDLQLPFGQFFITLVLVSILITWLQNNTGSLAPAFILHAFINMSGEVLPLINKNTEIQGDYTQWIISNLILTIFVFLILKHWGISTLTRKKIN